MPKVLAIVSDPENIGWPYKILGQIDKQGYKVEIDYPDTPMKEDPIMIALNKLLSDVELIKLKLGVT